MCLWHGLVLRIVALVECRIHAIGVGRGEG